MKTKPWIVSHAPACLTYRPETKQKFEIANQFRALKTAQSGSSDAVVFSAFGIEAAALADLGAVLQKRFGRKLNLAVELQPELIGGVRVVVGDEVLDCSVKARLEQMKVALTA